MSSLLCRIELNKTNGISVIVENENQQIIHTVELTGSEITTTSKSEDNTSAITQAPDKISLDCKSFELNAETIRCTASATTTHTSGDNFTVESGADFTAEVKKTAKLKAKTVKTDADTVTTTADKIDAEASQVTVKGNSQVEISGGVIKLQ